MKELTLREPGRCCNPIQRQLRVPPKSKLQPRAPLAFLGSREKNREAQQRCGKRLDPNRHAVRHPRRGRRLGTRRSGQSV